MSRYHNTTVPNIKLSSHAVQRQRERHLRNAALDYVLTYGTHIHRTGVTFVFLRERDIPVADRRKDYVTRLSGTVVIVGDRGRIVTVYRNQQALRDIRRKSKYDHSCRSRYDYQAAS